jgi:hypothetical protein
MSLTLANGANFDRGAGCVACERGDHIEILAHDRQPATSIATVLP